MLFCRHTFSFDSVCDVVSMAPPPAPSFRRRGCSKAQMCFFKILRIISDVRSSDAKCLNRGEENCEENGGFGVDLNISLRPPTEVEPVAPPVTAEGGGGDGGENCVLEKNDRQNEVEEERGTERSEISHVEDQSSEIGFNGVTGGEDQGDEGYLGLLIEAARLIEESETDKDPPPLMSKHAETSAAAAKGGAKRKQQWWTAAAEAEWYAEFEDASPVVKSRRGRNQVLPYKFRDSVVEPLVRWPPPSRHRSNSNVAVQSKQRSK